MIPGPTIIIACPSCGQYAKKKTLISGNTKDIILWSDGKRIAPYLPEFPSLVVCKKCDRFYWVEDAKEVAEVPRFSELNNKWKDTEYIEFPTFHQYYKALESISDEFYIRVSIWRSFNDYFRDKKEDEITAEMEQMHNENLIALLKIFDEKDNNELLMKAEVYRNLGQFDAGRELLKRINDPNLNGVKDKILAEINNQNIQVIQLNQNE